MTPTFFLGALSWSNGEKLSGLPLAALVWTRYFFAMPSRSRRSNVGVGSLFLSFARPWARQPEAGPFLAGAVERRRTA